MIAIGDVSGKGMPAALLMAQLSSEVRLLIQTELDPDRIVDRVNRDLCGSRNRQDASLFSTNVPDIGSCHLICPHLICPRRVAVSRVLRTLRGAPLAPPAHKPALNSAQRKPR